MSSEMQPLAGIRAKVVTVIREHVPDTWSVRDDVDTLETIDRPTVVVDFTTIDAVPSLRPGFVRCTFQVLIADNHEDDARADPALDEQVVDMLVALDGHRWLKFDTARKGRLEKAPYLGWTLTVTGLASASDDTPPEEPAPDDDALAEDDDTPEPDEAPIPEEN